MAPSEAVSGIDEYLLKRFRTGADRVFHVLAGGWSPATQRSNW
jgi:hypothetical protein